MPLILSICDVNWDRSQIASYMMRLWRKQRHIKWGLKSENRMRNWGLRNIRGEKKKSTSWAVQALQGESQQPECDLLLGMLLVMIRNIIKIPSISNVKISKVHTDLVHFSGIRMDHSTIYNMLRMYSVILCWNFTNKSRLEGRRRQRLWFFSSYYMVNFNLYQHGCKVPTSKYHYCQFSSSWNYMVHYSLQNGPNLANLNWWDFFWFQ